MCLPSLNLCCCDYNVARFDATSTEASNNWFKLQGTFEVSVSCSILCTVTQGGGGPGYGTVSFTMKTVSTVRPAILRAQFNI